MIEILLVEDNEGDAKLFEKTFNCKPPECSLSFAKDGQEALEILATGLKSRCLPDLVFLDLNIPKLSGLEVLKRMKEDPLTSGIPVIVLTSSNNEKDISEAYLRGACAFICKPMDLNVFRTVMEDTYRFWLNTNTFNNQRRPCA